MEMATPSLSMASTQVVSLALQRVVDVAVRRCLGQRRDAAAGCRSIFAGPEFERSLSADQLAPLGPVFFGEQPSSGMCTNSGIAVVSIAVGVGQLQGLHQGVDVLRRN